MLLYGLLRHCLLDVINDTESNEDRVIDTHTYGGIMLEYMEGERFQ